MIRGSCLCSAVRYEVSVPFEEMHHCHCSRCRKAHGAAFSTFGRVPATALTVTSGADAIRRYRSSAQVERAFCVTCGSNLTFRFDPLPELVWIAIGTIDDDPGMRPQGHIFAASIAPWHAITDDLPTFDQYPPQDE
ncbi:MAG: GFA family protein [Candidatus Binatia bacterium]